MWLLDTYTGQFEHVANPQDVPNPGYAILSHVWVKVGPSEQTFQDVQRLTAAALHAHIASSSTHSSPDVLAIPELCPKIRGFCALARKTGFRKVWIDTCCIDKTSSAELSEAINSMYQWYARAAICYAFLHDVPGDEDPHEPDSAFRTSEWFTRGWTLQELIAPSRVVFLSAEWFPLGTKASFADVIEEITGIDRDVLTRERALDSVSIARRMSWASRRSTTRVEDEAYALMGIFGVNIPTIYGEGRHAFVRLQEEILKRSNDQSILAWSDILDDRLLEQPSSGPDCVLSPSVVHNGVHEEEWEQNRLLASSARAFAQSGDVAPLRPEEFAAIIGAPFHPPEYTVTNSGMRMRVPLLTISVGPKTTHLAILACRTASRPDRLIALFLTPQPQSLVYLVGQYVRAAASVGDKTGETTFSRYRAITLATQHLSKSCMTTVYVPYRPPQHELAPDLAPYGPRRADYFGPCTVELLPWVRTRIQRAGYALQRDGDYGVNLAGPWSFDNEHVKDTTLVLVGADGEKEASVHLGLCFCQTRCCAYSRQPQSERTPQWSLSATVCATGRSACSSSTLGKRGAYVKRHIRAWENGAKTYKTVSVTVTLRFALLSDVGEVTRYSLDIDVQRRHGPASSLSSLSMGHAASSPVELSSSGGEANGYSPDRAGGIEDETEGDVLGYIGQYGSW
ncbi:Vegetative incompatibility protein HET-E-1 [Trametes pubescens]|uniref:Vegetative incompatibility protein HET-E-1 n=1 Tax=Trametes pubescens TaxID=154538 RepID=A0A1M2VKH1_TRAPU|nr:Vegetative incompatibility protein HET-E-1 [Trametes pubescens]